MVRPSRRHAGSTFVESATQDADAATSEGLRVEWAKAGELPTPNCDNSSNACSPTPGCTIDEAQCGSKSTCLPIGDNTGKDVLNLRIRRLNIATPAALASPFIQNTVVNGGMDLAEKSCAEQGKGLFTWLLRVDKKAGTIVTGGSPPATDP